MHQNRHYDAPGLIVGDTAEEQTSNAYAAYERDEAESWCECDWLGVGTPRHLPSPMCIELRPDGPRSA